MMTTFVIWNCSFQKHDKESKCDESMFVDGINAHKTEIKERNYLKLQQKCKTPLHSSLSKVLAEKSFKKL